MLKRYLWDRGISLEKKTVLEIGSGRYARIALQMLAAGAERVVAVDPFAIPLTDSAHQKILMSDCREVEARSR